MQPAVQLCTGRSRRLPVRRCRSDEHARVACALFGRPRRMRGAGVARARGHRRHLRGRARTRGRDGRADLLARVSGGRPHLRPDPARVARRPAHLAGNRHGQHRHLLLLDHGSRAWRRSTSWAGRFGARRVIDPGDPPCRRTRSARSTPARASFALRGVAWSLGLFGLLRLQLDRGARRPAADAAAGAARGGAASARRRCRSRSTLACSGADALALCLGGDPRLSGAVADARWPAPPAAPPDPRLNTLRIGTLGRAAASPAWFDALHVYVWPAVLTLAIAGYVFAWMRVADRRLTPARPAVPSAPRRAPSRGLRAGARRFVVLTAAFLVLFFTALSPLYLESAGVLAVAGFHRARGGRGTSARSASGAHAAANVLSTPRGGFLVTQECISTPLIPVYLAAVVAYRAPGGGVFSAVARRRCRSSSRSASRGCWSSPCLPRSALAAVPRSRVLSTARSRRSSCSWRRSGATAGHGRVRGARCSA